MEEKRVELNEAIAGEYFKLKGENEKLAEEYLLSEAKKLAPEGFEPTDYELNEAEKKIAVIYKEAQKDRRPPKDWWENCIKRARRFADDPESFCGALWYRPEDFPHGEKLREAFGEPYTPKRRSSLNVEEGDIDEELDDIDKMLVEAIEKGGFKKKETAFSFVEEKEIAKKGVEKEKEITQTEYRTRDETRGHKDYSSEGKGEGKWEDYRTSKFSEASLKLRLARLMRKLEQIERKLKEEEVKVRPRVEREVPIEWEDEEREVRVRPREERDRLDRVRRRLRTLTSKLLSEKEKEEDMKVALLKRKIANLRRKIAELEAEPEIEEEETFDELERSIERYKALRGRSASRLAKLKEIKAKRLARLKEKLARIREKVGTKKKAVFDPRVFTDLDPEATFGPHPEMADEVGERRREYKVDLAHEKSEEVKKPVPKTIEMVTEKPAEVEKAFIEKASKVIEIVDKMIDKGMISLNQKYSKINELLKFNDLELERIKKYVDEIKKDTIIATGDEFIDLEKIIGD